VSGQQYNPIPDPGFGYTAFELAPGYSDYYPSVRPCADPYYYGYYYPRWRSINLPTDGMLRRALPEGILNSGGRLDGYLYFEELTDDVERVAFRMDVVNARTGMNLGERIAIVLNA